MSNRTKIRVYRHLLEAGKGVDLIRAHLYTAAANDDHEIPDVSRALGIMMSHLANYESEYRVAINKLSGIARAIESRSVSSEDKE